MTEEEEEEREALRLLAGIRRDLLSILGDSERVEAWFDKPRSVVPFCTNDQDESNLSPAEFMRLSSDENDELGGANLKHIRQVRSLMVGYADEVRRKRQPS